MRLPGRDIKALVTQSDFGQAAATLLAPDAEADAHVLLLDMDGLAQADWRCSHDENRDRIVASADMLCAALSAYAEQVFCAVADQFDAGSGCAVGGVAGPAPWSRAAAGRG